MRKVLIYSSLVSVSVLCVLFAGCEGKPDTENVDSYFDGFAVDSVAYRPPTESAQRKFAIFPSSVTNVTNGAITPFSLEGAIGAVNWSVQDISKGSILTQSNQSATYQRAAAGDNVVIATDSRGNAAFATVSQP